MEVPDDGLGGEAEHPPKFRLKIPGPQALKGIYARSSPARRLLLGSGLLTFVAGLVLVGIGLASLGPSAPEPPPAAALVDITPSPSPRPATPTPVPTATPVPVPPLGDQPYRMVISKLGVDAPVSAFGLDANAVPQVPTGSGASKVVAWYDFSSQPGVGSNAVFAGHVTWNGPAVFYNLATLAAGDEVRLVGDDGREIVYRVTLVISVDPADPEAVSLMYATASDVITIVTCDPASTYTRTSDPVFGGEYARRLVVRGELASVNAAAVAPQPATGG